jgi:outer membrane lipopolysaccharide assembly protein LptE/RlpB
MKYKLSAAIILVAILAATGCGYSTAGKKTRLPSNVQTVAIPAFINQTQIFRIEQTMTAAVVKEFISRTKLQIVNEASADADATLHGTIVSTQIAPLTYDSQTGRASSGLVTVNLRVSLVDKKGKVLFDNPNYIYREQYQVTQQVSSFFQEESPAVERLSRDLARTLVTDILENY